MNVLSLFDGISCGQIALARAGIGVDRYFASEIDVSAISVTQKHWPKTIQLGDVRNIPFLIESGVLPKIDMVLAGSPCQGFSSAGLGLGFEDERSKLFFELLKILDLIQPRFFLVENVNMKKAWLDQISRYLNVGGVRINSSLFSGQLRDRWYWANWPIPQPSDMHVMLGDILEPGWVADRDKSYCIDANYGKGTNFKRYFHRGSRQIVFRENTIVGYKPTEKDANIVQRLFSGCWRKLTVAECERLQTLPENYTNGLSAQHAYKAIGNGWTIDVIAHVLTGSDAA